MKEDRTSGQGRLQSRLRRGDDGLGPSSDIGSKLRALYSAVQEEPIPSNLLDLLEKLDEAEQKTGHDHHRD